MWLRSAVFRHVGQLSWVAADWPAGGDACTRAAHSDASWEKLAKSLIREYCHEQGVNQSAVCCFLMEWFFSILWVWTLCPYGYREKVHDRHPSECKELNGPMDTRGARNRGLWLAERASLAPLVLWMEIEYISLGQQAAGRCCAATCCLLAERERGRVGYWERGAPLTSYSPVLGLGLLWWWWCHQLATVWRPESWNESK